MEQIDGENKAVEVRREILLFDRVRIVSFVMVTVMREKGSEAHPLR